MDPANRKVRLCHGSRAHTATERACVPAHTSPLVTGTDDGLDVWRHGRQGCRASRGWVPACSGTCNRGQLSLCWTQLQRAALLLAQQTAMTSECIAGETKVALVPSHDTQCRSAERTQRTGALAAHPTGAVQRDHVLSTRIADGEQLRARASTGISGLGSRKRLLAAALALQPTAHRFVGNQYALSGG